MKGKRKILGTGRSFPSMAEDKDYMEWSREHSTLPEARLSEEDIAVKKVDLLLTNLSFEPRSISEEETNEAWQAIQNKSHHLVLSKTYNSNSTQRYWIAAAIAAFVIGFVALMALQHHDGFEKDQLAIVEKSTAYGQKLSCRLPDGSKVILNSGSKLTYHQDFNGSVERRVELIGEAYFEVEHVDEKPFIVKTPSSETRVLGTVFNVAAYSEDTLSKVSLLKGSVLVSSHSTGQILRPGEQAVIGANEGVIRVEASDVSSLMAWKDGVLIFNKIAFDDLTTQLERWYGVDIEVASGTEINPNWRFHGRFKEKSLSYILEALSYPDQFDYKIENKHVTIY